MPHQHVFLQNPHPASRLAYLVTGLEIYWSRPVEPYPVVLDIPPGCSKRERNILKGNNEWAAFFNDVLREEAIEEFIADGVPAERLKQPSAEMEVRIQRRISMRKAILQLQDKIDGRGCLPDATVPDWLPNLPKLVVATVVKLNPGITGSDKRSPCSRAMDYLNAGIPSKDQSQRFTYQHIERALDKFWSCELPQFLDRSPEWLRTEATFGEIVATALFNPVFMLVALEIQAVRRPEFIGMTGAKLARAIDDAHDLRSVMHKLAPARAAA